MFRVYVPNVSSVFQIFVASVLSGCCVCFTRMLQVFYIDVAYVCNGFQEFLTVLQVFQTHVASVSAVSYICCKCVFIWTFQN
jgi:hypothetical protein